MNHHMPRQRSTEQPLPDAAEADPVPNAWAGGRQVVVPGAGAGFVVNPGTAGPRIVEAVLPMPAAAVFVVQSDDGPRAVVLADPRVDEEQLARTVAMAELLQQECDEPEPPARGLIPRSWRPTVAAVIVMASCVMADLAVTACTVFA